MGIAAFAPTKIGGVRNTRPLGVRPMAHGHARALNGPSCSNWAICQRSRADRESDVDELLGGLLDTCEAQGLRFPLTVTVISSGRILFCMRVNADANAELFHRHPDQARRLPITVVVVDADGERVRGRITEDDPDVLVVLHCRWRYGWRCYLRPRMPSWLLVSKPNLG